MTALVSDCFKWSRDDAGAWLMIKTDRAPALAQELNGRKTSVRFTEYRAGRSKDANAMYHAVLSQLAGALGISNNHLHNIMLRRYGAGPELLGDAPAYVYLPDDEATERAVDEAETYHLQPTSGVTVDRFGKTRRAYMMLRGSSTFDTKEFSRLLDGLLSECREVGLTPVF